MQTAALLVTLWISCGHPARIKHAGYLFEVYLSITLAVIWISRTVAGPTNWMWSKSLWEFLLILYWLPYSKVTIRISIISVVSILSIIIVAHRTYHTFIYQIFQQLLIWWIQFVTWIEIKINRQSSHIHVVTVLIMVMIVIVSVSYPLLLIAFHWLCPLQYFMIRFDYTSMPLGGSLF